VHSTTPYVDILLAEDNPGDTLLLQDCFLRYSHLRPQFHVVDDGEAALAFLHQHDSYAEAPRPHLILLDIRLPKRDGWEVLTTIRATPELARIPVVMLTGLITEADKESRETLQPSECLEKPMHLSGYPRLVEIVEQIIRQSPSSGGLAH
jgi:two-component system, chemotaxis family, response regulator Rcp1